MATLASNLSQLPWAVIVSSVLGTGLIAALANHLFQSRRTSIANRQAASITARKAAGDLENYAREATDVAESWGTADIHDPHSRGTRNWPEAPPLDSYDWSPFEQRGLVDRALGFKNDIAKGRAVVSAYFEDDDQSGLDEGAELALRLGLQAWALAADLRKTYRFPEGTSRVNSHYDYVTWMNAEQDRRAVARDKYNDARSKAGM